MDEIPLRLYSNGFSQNVSMETGFSQSPVTNQPQGSLERQDIFSGTRRPIPVSVIYENASQLLVTPLNGLDFMIDAHQLIIQQSVELMDLMTNVSSENRYIVKIPRGDTIFYATETSQSFQRTCFGSGRAFSIRLYDSTQQEAISFQRRLACGNCTFWCYLQRLEVWIPPGELIGTVCQNMHITRTRFSVCNRNGETLFIIEGPNSFGCLLENTENFKIFSEDGSTQIGSIIHQWDQVQVSYNLLLQLPGSVHDTRHKALLLGAAFLLEYMFFENSKKRTGCRCIC